MVLESAKEVISEWTVSMTLTFPITRVDDDAGVGVGVRMFFTEEGFDHVVSAVGVE